MHIHFIGIGGTGIGPLALIAKQYGYEVSGSDKQPSQYIDYLTKHGVKNVNISDSPEQLGTMLAELHAKNPVDWVVYTSAVKFENPDHPEILFAKESDIKLSKRDELLSHIISESGQKLIAVAGTHGKTTTTAMAIWLFKQLEIPLSYSVGAKIPFGDMGTYNPNSDYFVYECDEFDRNFLAFSPYISLITGVDYDHHEIYPSQKDYQEAFQQFINQSNQVVIWSDDQQKNNFVLPKNTAIIQSEDSMLNSLSIVGEVNRKDAIQVMYAISELVGKDPVALSEIMEQFPGLSRRFEQLAPGLYTDYAHTVPKIAGCLQLAAEISKDVVVVYEPLTNRRQHFVREQYKSLFNNVKQLYWVPTYLAREDPSQHIITPQEFISELDCTEKAIASELDENLKNQITTHLNAGDTVVCMSGGGGNSLDEWLRKNFR